MKRLAHGCCVLLLSVMIGSCGGGAPACSDPVVKKTVLEITHKELVEQMFKVVLSEKAGAYPAAVLGRFSVETWRNNPPDPKQVANFTFQVSEILALIDEAEARVKAANATLAEIRLMEKKDDVKFSSCGASIAFSNGNKIPVTFTAQLTEDNSVYVEVKGL